MAMGSVVVRATRGLSRTADSGSGRNTVFDHFVRSRISEQQCCMEIFLVASRSLYRERAEAHTLYSSSLALALWPSRECVANPSSPYRFRHPISFRPEVDVTLFETLRIYVYHVLVTSVLNCVGGWCCRDVES